MPLRNDRAIALVGLRGAGKSTVGLLLAAKLGRPFVDLDDEIAREVKVRGPDKNAPKQRWQHDGVV